MKRDIYNFIQSSSNIQMSSLYFASTNLGYVKKPAEGNHSVGPIKTIPVYKTVNEYMNLPKRDEPKVIKEVEEDFEIIESQNTSRSLDTPIKRAKCIVLNSAKMMQKPQVQSINGDEVPLESLKENQYSSKDTSASRVQNINQEKMRISLINTKIGKNELYEDTSRNSLLQIQIGKEKTLRKNLQNSYKSLLQKFKSKEYQYEMGFTEDSQNTKRKTRVFFQKQNQNEEVPQQYILAISNKQNRDQTKMKKSCCELQKNQQKILSKQYCKSQPSEQDVYQDHLEGERVFQNHLWEQIEKTMQRVDELEHRVMQRQYQVQNMLKDKQLELKTKEIQYLTSQDNHLKYLQTNSQVCHNQSSIKDHIHYIFTIFIMFVIIAMILKKETISK